MADDTREMRLGLSRPLYQTRSGRSWQVAPLEVPPRRLRRHQVQKKIRAAHVKEKQRI